MDSWCSPLQDCKQRLLWPFLCTCVFLGVQEMTGKPMARAMEDGWVQWADTFAMMSLRCGEGNFRSQLHSLSGDVIGVEMCILPWTRKPTAWFSLSPWLWWRYDHEYIGMGLRNRGPSSWPSDSNSFLLALMGIIVVWVLGSAQASKDSASNLVHTSILWPLESTSFF